MMNKSSILLLSVLSVLVLSACTPSKTPENINEGATNNTAGEVTKPSEPSANTGANLGTCLDSCKIIKEDTGLISKETCRVGCYMAEAQEKKDPEVCISNVNDDLMLPACLTGVAEKLGDIAICDKIGADKNDLMRGACYSTVVEKTGDVSVCEGIKDSMMYTGCLEAVRKG